MYVQPYAMLFIKFFKVSQVSISRDINKCLHCTHNKKREKEFNKNKERRKMRQFTINSCHILLFKREIWDYGKEKKVKC